MTVVGIVVVIGVDDAFVQVTAVFKQVWHYQLVGCAIAGNLRWRANQIVCHIAQLIAVFYAHHVATVGKDETQLRQHALVLQPLQRSGHLGDVHPLAVVDTIGTTLGYRIRLDNPSGGVAPQHQTVLLGRTQRSDLLQHFTEQFGVGGIEVVGVFVEGVQLGFLGDSGNKGLLVTDGPVDKYHQVVVLGDARDALLHFADVLRYDTRQIVVARHIDHHGALGNGWRIVVLIFLTSCHQNSATNEK